MENEEITVTATQHDRELATKMSHVSIEGENAVWKNSWKAAGGDITWNMLHYDVQLIGGMVLHDGKVAEMATGEGKTLVATLPAYLNGVAGQGVHIITVNDYLARRDQEWVGPIFQFLLLTVDCIDKYRPNSPERREAYACDITYGTNNEFGFDYLRDNMVRTVAEKVQRQHQEAHQRRKYRCRRGRRWYCTSTCISCLAKEPPTYQVPLRGWCTCDSPKDGELLHGGEQQAHAPGG